jgi:hypothetical protein
MGAPDPLERRVIVQAGDVDDERRVTRTTLQQPLRWPFRRRDRVHQ